MKLTDSDISLMQLLTTLNERIEVLVDRDHTIGHAYFMNINDAEGLKKTFADKVIPLLQEYFYGDYGKMEMVIGKDFFEERKDKKITFASNDYQDIEQFRDAITYQLKSVNEMDNDEFILAIENLINPTKGSE